MAGCVVAIDVGGTFTDIALADLETGQLWTSKTPTTPHDQSQGFATGVAKVLQESGKTPGDVIVTLHTDTFIPSADRYLSQQGKPVVGQVQRLGVRLDWAELRKAAP